VRITLGDGTLVNRFFTLYRAPEGVQWQTLGPKIKIPVVAGDSPEAVRQQQDTRGNEGFSPHFAMLLAGLSKVTLGTRVPVDSTASPAGKGWGKPVFESDSRATWQKSERVGGHGLEDQVDCRLEAHQAVWIFHAWGRSCLQWS